VLFIYVHRSFACSFGDAAQNIFHIKKLDIITAVLFEVFWDLTAVT